MNLTDSAWWKHVDTLSISGRPEVYSYTAALEYKVMARHGEGDQHFEAPKTGEHGSSEALLRATESPRGVSQEMFGDKAGMINSHLSALRDGNFQPNADYDAFKTTLLQKVIKSAAS